ARSGRNTGPWPKPNSSMNSAKLMAAFLPAGQTATGMGARGNAVTQSAASCAKVAQGKSTANSPAPAPPTSAMNSRRFIRSPRQRVEERPRDRQTECLGDGQIDDELGGLPLRHALTAKRAAAGAARGTRRGNPS